MDTERDENQNLKNDIDRKPNNSDRVDGTEESLNQIGYDDEFENDEDQEGTDYIDDQNNSNTGYTEKLLEKEFNQDCIDKEFGIEDDFDIEDDLVVKNGDILSDEKDKKKSDQKNND